MCADSYLACVWALGAGRWADRDGYLTMASVLSLVSLSLLSLSLSCLCLSGLCLVCPLSLSFVFCVVAQAPSGLTDGGYKKRGSLAVSKIDAAGFYYLNIEGEPGHALKCILQVARVPHPLMP